MDYRGCKYEQCLYEKMTERIVRLTFNRPERRNALNDQMYNEFQSGLHQADDDPDIRVVIIRGAGPCFGSGHELSSPKGEESPPVHPSLNPTLMDYFGFERRRCGKQDDAQQYPKILISQVHGFCLGASEEIAAISDIVIADEEAIFGVRGFTRLPFGISAWPGYWPAESNKNWAGKLAPEISGKQAEEIGTITKAVKKENLEAEVMKWASALANLPLEVIAVYKEWLCGTMDILGMGTSYRSHYGKHNTLQYVRFRPEEVNLYKEKKDSNLSGFIKKRHASATVKDKG